MHFVNLFSHNFSDTVQSTFLIFEAHKLVILYSSQTNDTQQVEMSEVTRDVSNYLVKSKIWSNFNVDLSSDTITIYGTKSQILDSVLVIVWDIIHQ